MVQWLCARKPADTTSEPLTGNGQTGAPVTASMSGSLAEQPGWNRGILCIPPLFRQGMGIFYALPKEKC